MHIQFRRLPEPEKPIPASLNDPTFNPPKIGLPLSPKISLSALRWAFMSLDPTLLEVLACPKDKGPLTYLEEEQLLVNERLNLAYRIEDGIPVLLIDEAVEWSPSEK